MHPVMYLTNVVIRPRENVVNQSVVDDESLAAWTVERRRAWRAWAGGAPSMPAQRRRRWTGRPIAASGRPRTLNFLPMP
jgi:hypothetical protein